MSLPSKVTLQHGVLLADETTCLWRSPGAASLCSIHEKMVDTAKDGGGPLLQQPAPTLQGLGSQQGHDITISYSIVGISHQYDVIVVYHVILV